ncbi:MAG: cytochrome-c oxidase, cbb3-type subunit II [Arenicella sp.]|jgi:cytochrome c oxidase cbb3-type subunit 2|nr:cytochrome-c oxidase, cbb3-type subunit II [Arenicella sp.]
MKHETIEKNSALMGVLIALVISVAGIAEIVPLMFQAQTTQPSPGVVPYPAVELAGRDVYVKEGCYNCHSQMIRPFVSESLRYGPPSLAGESVYDRPHQWGSKRTGPDLARVGGRYTDEWHLTHLINPRDLVPESNMPGFPWLLDKQVDGELITTKMRALRWLGDPYTDEQIANAIKDVEGVTEMDALIAYLQFLGVANNGRAQQ